jgi:iron complex transport system substrate-binding protein
LEKKGVALILAGILVMAIFMVAVISILREDEDEDGKYLVGNYTLEIFGNANGDWYLDRDDVVFLEKIISGDENETLFADTNRDGSVDQKDITQLEKILADDADNIWIVDGNGDPVKVDLPIRRIGVEYLSNAELMNVLDADDRVVAADSAAYIMKDIYFPGRDLLQMGQMHANPDFENIFEMDLDVLFTFSPTNNDVKQEKLLDTDVVFLGLYWPNVIEPRDSRYLQGVLKAGYLLGSEDRAYDYNEWLLGIVDDIGSKTSSIADGDRPDVLMTSHNRYFKDEEEMAASIYTKIDPLSQACMLAGGRPIAEDLDNWIGEGQVYGTTVDLEWIIERDPDFIFAHSVRYTYSGLSRDPAYGYDCDDPEPFTNAVDDMKSRPLLSGISAIENNNIYITAGDFRNNAMGGILGAAYLVKILHPGLLPDLDPREIHQEFITEWMGLDYDLGTRGVFISPSLEQS